MLLNNPLDFVSGIIQQYSLRLQEITVNFLYFVVGPTNFAPIINQITRYVKYYFLTILGALKMCNYYTGTLYESFKLYKNPSCGYVCVIKLNMTEIPG